jgi:hypothetical protein
MGVTMKKLLLLVLIAGTMLVTSCKSDDSSTGPETAVDPIVGTWLSTGTNLAYGLSVAPLNVRSITATFRADKTYSVVQTDVNNVTTTLTGTYTSTASTSTDALTTYGTQGKTIYNIVANQSSPAAVTATGIYAINGTAMSYEVIQTTPAINGVSAPTAAGGFGSTTIAGTKYAIYVQKYVKQ